MATKVCTQCFVEKDIAEFPLQNQFTLKRQSYCKDCKSIMHRNWYERNKGYQKENAKKHRIDYRQTLRQYVLDYLSNHPCLMCGESDPVVLEFHHARGEKETDVSVLIGRGSSLEKLQVEIEKCDVLCANCHRKLTAKERGWFKR